MWHMLKNNNQDINEQNISPKYIGGIYNTGNDVSRHKGYANMILKASNIS